MVDWVEIVQATSRERNQRFTGAETEALLVYKLALPLGISLAFLPYSSLFTIYLPQPSPCLFCFLRTWASLRLWFVKAPYPPEEFFATLLPLLTASGSQFPIPVFWETYDGPVRPWVRGLFLGPFSHWTGGRQEQGQLTWSLAVDGQSCLE